LAIIAGIDEAGFGPLLGPLVVSATAFRVPDERVDRCLWDTLVASCSCDIERSGRRLAIADSKKLYRARGDLSLLERSVLVMLGALTKSPRTWRGLLDEIAPKATAALEAYPWYAVTDLPIPVGEGVGDIPTRANALRRDLADNRVELLGVLCEPLPEGHYNRLVGSTNNKSVALLGLALRLVDRIFRSGWDERVRIGVDRLGGRMHYREPLQTAFPGFDLRIVEETAQRSAYRLAGEGRVCRIEFVVGGEDRFFAVALASMVSKYVRELYMRVFNDYWCRQHAGLKPTAGYFTDAKRWLRDAAPALKRLSVDRNTLVRMR
jgi:ribonuclease HII